jgi:hypothetical protein
MRDTMRVTVYQNGTPISATYELTGASVAYAKIQADASVTDLVNAMMNYADCAKAAFE